MPDDPNYTPGALLAWHQPERYQLYAHCVRCHREAELYIPGLMQAHRLPDHMAMERVRLKLRCTGCGQTMPRICKVPVGSPGIGVDDQVNSGRCGMCARKMMVTDLDKVRQIFGVTAGPTPNFAPRYNLPITERAPIVWLDGEGQRRIELATWDYRDGSVANLKGRPPFYNARAESMSKSEAFARCRCLLPCDGFYEWLTVTEPSRKTARKIPFLFRRQDRQPFAMGGVWSEWCNPEGGTELTFVELTVAPSPLVAEIHNRMSLIIDPAHYSTYLEGLPDEARGLIGPNPMVGFERLPVSSRVNSVRNDGPEVIEPPEAHTPPAQHGLFA